MTSDLVGKGMPLWLPNGAIIRKQLENYIYEKERKWDTYMCIHHVLVQLNYIKLVDTGITIKKYVPNDESRR